jgi:ATP-dependent Lon protease
VGVISLLGRSDRGGCVLTLESLIIEGEGKLVLTGNLDNTFHESALVAIDYIRSRSEKFGVEADFHTKYDIHLHIQEAATPKYGVSAGMAIVTALVSSLTGRPVRRSIGMTGEVSLHGKVLGVRDIRDKAIAAYQAGIRTIFVPAENEFELKYMPAEVRREVSFYPLESVDIAVEKALISS